MTEPVPFKKRYAAALAAAMVAFAASGGIGGAQTLIRLAEAKLVAAEAGEATPARPLGVDARIPFVSMGSIADWWADGTNGLYVQDLHRQWYHAAFIGHCTDLPFVDAIGFETRGANVLDRFSTVVVRGQRCAFSSFVTSAPPPSGKRKDAEAPKG